MRSSHTTPVRSAENRTRTDAGPTGPRRRTPAVEARRTKALAALPHPLFTSEAARTAGLTAADLRTDAVVPVRRGVFTRVETEMTTALRCAAALLVQPDARVSHLSAAELWGLPVPTTDRLHLSYPALPRRRLADTTAHRHAPGTTETFLVSRGVGRLAVSCPISLVHECAAILPLVDLVVLADAVLARPDVDPAEALERWRHARGPHAALVRQAAHLARAEAESPAETRTRLLSPWPDSRRRHSSTRR